MVGNNNTANRRRPGSVIGRDYNPSGLPIDAFERSIDSITGGNLLSLTENWRLINFGLEDWLIPSFLNSWVNVGSPYKNVGYRKSADGLFVYLCGVISSGVIGSAAFILPSNYRPTNTCILSTISNNAVGRVDVDNSGNVIPVLPSVNTWVSLDNLKFSID